MPWRDGRLGGPAEPTPLNCYKVCVTASSSSPLNDTPRDMIRRVCETRATKS